MAELASMEPTLGEVVRRLDAISKQVSDIPTAMDQAYLRRETFESEKSRIDARIDVTAKEIDQIKSRNEWLVRSVIGLVIIAVLGTAFTLYH